MPARQARNASVTKSAPSMRASPSSTRLSTSRNGHSSSGRQACGSATVEQAQRLPGSPPGGTCARWPRAGHAGNRSGWHRRYAAGCCSKRPSEKGQLGRVTGQGQAHQIEARQDHSALEHPLAVQHIGRGGGAGGHHQRGPGVKRAGPDQGSPAVGAEAGRIEIGCCARHTFAAGRIHSAARPRAFMKGPRRPPTVAPATLAPSMRSIGPRLASTSAKPSRALRSTAPWARQPAAVVQPPFETGVAHVEKQDPSGQPQGHFARQHPTQPSGVCSSRAPSSSTPTQVPVRPRPRQ
jgi:hypothetical protein